MVHSALPGPYPARGRATGGRLLFALIEVEPAHEL